jgi:short-subunit dehydrogenase
MNLFDLTGKTALVTGSSRGLGRGMARPSWKPAPAL